MARILVGWELGGERGHAALLEPVAEALMAHGHEVLVAAKDPVALTGRAGLTRAQVLQAPLWPPPLPEAAGPNSQTLADDLVAAGLSKATDLQERARAWADLIDGLDIDIALAESAPTLLLAAGTRCPAIAFGSAYSVPPAGRSLPAVLDNQRLPAASSLANEEALRLAFDRADRAFGGEGLTRLGDLYAVPTWVCNLAELDPYGSLRATRAPGPLQIPALDESAMRNRRFSALGDRVFVYIKPIPALPALMGALAAQCRQLEVFIPGMPAQVDNPWPHVTLHRSPLDVTRRLPEFSTVVHFGGLNLAAEALFAGVPQLILPQHLEQSATALAIQQLGLGYCQLNVPREPERETERQAQVNRLVQTFFADAGLASRAADFGTRLRLRQQPSLPGLVSLCEELLS